MDSASSIFEVLIKLALPVFALSFVMVWFALRHGVLSETDGIGALRKEIDTMSKERKKAKKNKEAGPPKQNFFHEKWLRFGGGFYGIVALYTYGLIEFHEIRNLIASYGGIPPFIDALSIRLIINMFIEALTNFIAAITWPLYWMRDFGSENMWIWIVTAYGAYWLGIKVALLAVNKQQSAAGADSDSVD